MKIIKKCSCRRNGCSNTRLAQATVLPCSHIISQTCARLGLTGHCRVSECNKYYSTLNIRPLFIPVEQVPTAEIESTAAAKQEQLQMQATLLRNEIVKIKALNAAETELREHRKVIMNNFEAFNGVDFCCLEFIHCSTNEKTKILAGFEWPLGGLKIRAATEFGLDSNSRMILCDRSGQIFNFSDDVTVAQLFRVATRDGHQFHIERAEAMTHRIDYSL